MENYNNTEERALGWDDEIEKESSFILIPPGDYDFKVTSFERARHDGSAKLPACNKAIVFCTIETPEGKATIKNNLFLHTTTESFLSAFFTSIGQKKKGERLKMNWNTVVGSTGRCKVVQYVGEDGNTYNDIKRFYPKEEPKGFIPGQF